MTITDHPFNPDAVLAYLNRRRSGAAHRPSDAVQAHIDDKVALVGEHESRAARAADLAIARTDDPMAVLCVLNLLSRQPASAGSDAAWERDMAATEARLSAADVKALRSVQALIATGQSPQPKMPMPTPDPPPGILG